MIESWGLRPFLLVLPRMIQSGASGLYLSLDYPVCRAAAPALDLPWILQSEASALIAPDDASVLGRSFLFCPG